MNRFLNIVFRPYKLPWVSRILVWDKENKDENLENYYVFFFFYMFMRPKMSYKQLVGKGYLL